MIVLDENINEHQCILLRSWRVRFRLIGNDIAYKGIQDEQIIPAYTDNISSRYRAARL